MGVSSRALQSTARARKESRGTHVVGGERGAGRNLRTQLNRIVEAAGLSVWPKTFVNLRASRRTELQEEFPDHVVNMWLGHSSQVAEKHYLRVTPDHWARAVGGNAGGNIPAAHTESGTSQTQKNSGNPPPEWDGFPLIAALAPPLGLEPRT